MAGIENGWGLDVILWFQSWRSPLLESVYLIFHTLGQEDFFLLILPFVYWCVNERWGRRLTALFVLNLWLNASLKEWWHRPRPYEVSSQVQPGALETSWGIPSGHAQHATVLFGAIALERRKVWVTVLVVIYVLLMAISRMGLGVHYPQDAIGGILIGLALLGLYVWLEPRLSAWIGGLGLWQQIALTVAVAAILLIIHPLLIPATAVEGLAPAGTAVGALLGLGIGMAFEVRTSRFSAEGEWWQRIARYALGIAVMMGIRFGLSALFSDLEPALVFRLIRYTVIGLWAAWWAPWIFVRIGLAGHREPASPPHELGAYASK